MTAMLFLFAYDVSDDRRRTRIAAVLERHGTRVLESVFEVRTRAADAERLLAALDARRGPGDRVRMYAVPEDGRVRSRQLGGAPIAEAREFWLL